MRIRFLVSAIGVAVTLIALLMLTRDDAGLVAEGSPPGALSGSKEDPQGTTMDGVLRMVAMRHGLEMRRDRDLAGEATAGRKRGVIHRTFGDPSESRASTVESFHAVTPTEGEGAPETDWDELAPAARIAQAQEAVEIALERADEARTESEQSEWRARAAHELAAVRADMFSTPEGKEQYLELEEKIDG